MKYWYQPHKSIKEYVKRILVLKNFTVSDSFALPLYANGLPNLLFKTQKGCIGNKTKGNLTLFGQTITPENWVVEESFTLIAYFFEPYALGPLFDIPARELTDHPIDLTSWRPTKISELTERLLDTDATRKKLKLLNKFILNLIKNSNADCQAIKYSADQLRFCPIPDALPSIRDKLNMSTRTFQRRFKKQVGITPNQYRRVCQFDSAFWQLRSREFQKLSDIAYQYGYSDQSHYNRAFREFTNITPKEYLQLGVSRIR
jgi:AraC-like DNA-binding protein